MKLKRNIARILLFFILSASILSFDKPYATVYAATESQMQAIDYAKDYLKKNPICCKEDLMEALYPKYDWCTAEYAIDNCGVNWNKRAVKAAKSFLKSYAYSKNGLILQLVIQGFTEKEARYGVKNCGASWNKQAVRAAEEYCEHWKDRCDLSVELIMKTLHIDGFTDAQIEYAMSRVTVIENKKDDVIEDYAVFSYEDFME